MLLYISNCMLDQYLACQQPRCLCLPQVSSALDKLSTRERFLNSQCKGLTSDYAEAKENLSQLQKRYNQKQDAVAQQDMELAQIMKVKDGSHAK